VSEDLKKVKFPYEDEKSCQVFPKPGTRLVKWEKEVLKIVGKIPKRRFAFHMQNLHKNGSEEQEDKKSSLPGIKGRERKSEGNENTDRSNNVQQVF